MEGVTLKDVIVPKKSNCRAKCEYCKGYNVGYSILNGSYIYYCLDCKKWDDVAVRKDKYFNDFIKRG